MKSEKRQDERDARAAALCVTSGSISIMSRKRSEIGEAREEWAVIFDQLRTMTAAKDFQLAVSIALRARLRRRSRRCAHSTTSGPVPAAASSGNTSS